MVSIADALNSIPAKAYRRGMSRLINQLPPNPRLQRTRSPPLRSPLLSLGTLGPSHHGRWFDVQKRRLFDGKRIAVPYKLD
jgi:hypothetical protein